MICPNCQNMLPNDAVYCNVCGGNVSKMKQPVPPGFWKKTVALFLILLVAATASVCAATYFITRFDYPNYLLRDSFDLNKKIEDAINGDSFTMLGGGDEDTFVYQNTKELLTGIANNIKWQFDLAIFRTVKATESGELIYLVDSLHSGDDSFRHLGTPVEPGLADTMMQCLNGMIIHDSKIKTTKWGSTVSAYYPFYDDNKNVVGVVCMDLVIDTRLDNAIMDNLFWAVLWSASGSVVLTAVITTIRYHRQKGK